jgi:hypothetical protein
MVRITAKVVLMIIFSGIAVLLATAHQLAFLPWLSGKYNGILPALELEAVNIMADKYRNHHLDRTAINSTLKVK